MSRLNSLDFAPNHPLDFHVTREAFSDPIIEAVCFGLVGLTSKSGLNDYKHRLGYEIQPMNSVFLLHPWAAKVLSSSAALGSVAWLRGARPGYHRLGQIESILTGARMTRMGLAEGKA